MKRILLAFSLLLTSSALAAPQRVTTSFSILEDFVRNVGGSRVTVSNIVPADGDTHTYQPATTDIQKMAQARLIFVNGVGFESWLSKLIANAGGEGKVVTVSSGLKANTFDEDGQKVDDPHMWLDLSRSEHYVRQIAQALTQADPAGKAFYAANSSRYLGQIKALDRYAKTQVACIPAPSRKLVTNHDALGYFAARYGFKIVGEVIPSLGTEQEPSAQDMAKLSRAIKKEGVKAIFTENVVNKKLAETVAGETGAKIAPPLFTDALGAKGTAQNTFLKAFRYNIDTLVGALK